MGRLPVQEPLMLQWLIAWADTHASLLGELRLACFSPRPSHQPSARALRDSEAELLFPACLTGILPHCGLRLSAYPCKPKQKQREKKRRTDCAWQLVRGKVWEQTQNLGEKRFLKHPTHIHTEMMKQNREGKGVKGWCKEIQHCHRLFGRNKRKSYQSKHTKSMPCGHTNT